MIEMRIIRVADIDMAYVDRGVGMPVLLVHGFPLDHTMWDAQIEALSQRCRVIAPDLRGFGRTPLGTIDPDRGIPMHQFADDLAELLTALAINEPVVLCGLSMGGYIAWQFVRRHADQLRALVVCDTRAAADTDEARAARMKMIEHIHEWGAARVADMMGPRLFAPRSFETMPIVVQALRRVVERTAPASIAAAQRGMAARPDMTGFLPQIKVPTLVLCGDQDAICPPSEMASIAAAIPGAELVIVPDSGHMTTLEQPAIVNDALVRFLARS
jgi:pimeloyl-ACP methyl ester carboxylesterase